MAPMESEGESTASNGIERGILAPSEDLPQHLSKGLGTLYVIHGEALLLAIEAADAATKAADVELAGGRDDPRIVNPAPARGGRQLGGSCSADGSQSCYESAAFMGYQDPNDWQEQLQASLRRAQDDLPDMVRRWFDRLDDPSLSPHAPGAQGIGGKKRQQRPAAEQQPGGLGQRRAAVISVRQCVVENESRDDDGERPMGRAPEFVAHAAARPQQRETNEKDKPCKR